MSADGRPGDAGRGGLDEELHAWVLAVTGATAVRAEQRPGGASRVGWALDVSHPDGRVEALWLRTDRPEAQREEGADSLRREAAVYRALAPTEVRVPAVVAVHPTREAFVMERVEGRTWFSELRDDEAREAVARDFTSQLAALHRLRPASLDLPALGPVRSIHELVTEELDGAFARARAAAEPPEPLLCLALRWLRRTVPDDGDVPVVLVQGDTGPGNFMYAEERVVAVLDWELAHWGDPHDDLAWLYLRDLQERFTSMPRRLAQYAAESGVPVDLERLRWFRVLAELRCAGGIMGTLASAQPSAEFPNLLIYGVLHLRALAEDLAVRTGVQRGDPFVPDAAPTERTRLFDLGIGDLRTTIGPRVDDALAKRRTSGLARLLKYLRELDRLGPAVAAAEREELGALLGRRVDDDVEGRRALAHGILAGEHDDAEVARYGLGRADRLTAVCHDAMGALADRHFSPLALGEPPPARRARARRTMMDEWGLIPEDDGYHVPDVDDPAWHETVWFAWMVPERKILGYFYPTFRANLGIHAASVLMFDDSADLPWEALFHLHDTALPMPAELDLRHARLDNSMTVECLVPGRVFTFGFTHPEITLDLRYEALMQPLVTRGDPPFKRAVHIDQPGRVTGTVELRGERIDVDCFAMRDRMWGIRRQSRDPKRQLKVGYCYAIASAEDAFLGITVDRDGVDAAMTGFSMRDGVWSKVASGERRVVRDERGRPDRVAFDGVDELGRELHAEGRAVSREVSASNMVCWNSLVRWDLNGHDCWGEDQDVWPVHLWRSLVLGDRA